MEHQTARYHGVDVRLGRPVYVCAAAHPSFGTVFDVRSVAGAAMVCGFAYGPGAGTAVAAMAIVIHALTTGDWVGALMNLVATLGYILPAAIVYQKMHTYKGAVIGLVLGVIAATALSMVANLTIGVWFWYGAVDVIAPLMIPAVLPFNLIKTVLNSVLTLAVYKAVSNLITPKKDQVKGRA